LPEDFNGATTPENSSQVGIEEFFNDPTLISLIDQALVGNQELRFLNEDVQIASNEVLARRGAYLPLVTAGGGPSVTKPTLYTPESTSVPNPQQCPGPHPIRRNYAWLPMAPGDTTVDTGGELGRDGDGRSFPLRSPAQVAPEPGQSTAAWEFATSVTLRR
jgi:hypothetical protein